MDLLGRNSRSGCIGGSGDRHHQPSPGLALEDAGPDVEHLVSLFWRRSGALIRGAHSICHARVARTCFFHFPTVLAPSQLAMNGRELMSELWAVVRAPCTSSTVRMFFRTEEIEKCHGDRAADHGRSERHRLQKDVFDMLALL